MNTTDRTTVLSLLYDLNCINQNENLSFFFFFFFSAANPGLLNPLLLFLLADDGT